MTLVRNKPSADGYALGEHLARFCQQEIEKYRQTGMVVPQRCNTCAFRKASYAHVCVPTFMDALKCTVEGDTVFLCHEHRKGDEPSLSTPYRIPCSDTAFPALLPARRSPRFASGCGMRNHRCRRPGTNDSADFASPSFGLLLPW
jgi:hypothetical protein